MDRGEPSPPVPADLSVLAEPDGANLVDAAIADEAVPSDLASPIDQSFPSDLATIDAALPPGPSWKPEPVLTNQKLQSVWASSPSDVWAVGYVFLHGSGDPLVWQQVNVPGHGFGVWGLNAQDFWVVGRYVTGNALAGVAFEGTGSPTTFTNSPWLDSWGLYGMWPQSSESIWAVGDEGSVVHGQGSPMSWSVAAIDSYPSSHRLLNAFPGCRQLFGIWGAGDELWAVGSNEAVLHGGADPSQWTLDHMGSGGSGGQGCSAGDIEFMWSSDLRGIWGTSATNIWAVGHDGLILHGTGSPVTWTKVASGTSEHLLGIWGTSPSNVWVVGTNGIILHGTGTPLTWSPVQSGTTSNLHGVWGRTPTDIWAVGAHGTIVHYSP
jgi:hypothetical protein